MARISTIVNLMRCSLYCFSAAFDFHLFVEALSPQVMEFSTVGTSLLAHKASAKRTQSYIAEKPTILYGIESCDSEPYNLMVQAQLETWGKNMSRENFVIVGGAYDDYKKNIAADKMPCDDAQSGLACKEAVLLARAVQRARELDAQWLVLGQDDKYVWPEEVEAALSKLDASAPKIYSSFGCGQGWENHAESDHGKKPQPSGWVQPAYSCKAVWENAGICGGPTYILSRGALEKLLLRDQSVAAFIEEFTTGAKGPGGASDMYASCLYYSRGISFKNALPGRDVGIHLTDTSTQGMEAYILKEIKGSSSHAPLTAHLTMPKDLIPTFIRKTADTFSPALLEEQAETQNMERTSLDLAMVKSRLLYMIHSKTNAGIFSS